MGKHKGDHRWLWTVVCTFGMFSFVPFVWAAVQVRGKRFSTAAIVSSVGAAIAFTSASVGGLFEAAEQAQTLRESGVPESVVKASVARGDAWAYWVIVAVWLGSSLYALYLNPEYVQWRSRRLGHQSLSGGSVPPFSPPAAPTSWIAPAPSTSTVQITNNIYGGVNNVNAQANVVQAGGNVKGVHGGKVEQSATSWGVQPEVVLAFISQYRAALVEMDHGSRQVAEVQLDQLAAEMRSAEPDEVVVNRHLHTLKALAHHAVASGAAKAAAVAGSTLMATLLDGWPS